MLPDSEKFSIHLNCFVYPTRHFYDYPVPVLSKLATRVVWCDVYEVFSLKQGKGPIVWPRNKYKNNQDVHSINKSAYFICILHQILPYQHLSPALEGGSHANQL